ncbi:hypothetical protein BATDEDRAFT_86469 [Batrachochytrium dendrobatidis JAM81]|uniref:F-box domain-containing protein n=1 Tax=Batrachochytrium dendrobatidis (strain JAM81 / FGSC 10211) TaxID=684364 RepID=F4NVY3_BATDJ|nr:uncharacterized protein BATDEDRAFT_86469 [Batrachochytrium dendrobatidis JAM81]EGF82735.1 hypothetical protein BATDEDRAFT_86469 [Batrachochytrium dendrobatidis JAM81]|eukprot:XP_006677036.1 hypothetical protein BATDEDRAFT_86469 [Batrachochytrium dendrobatidis JAM81]
MKGDSSANDVGLTGTVISDDDDLDSDEENDYIDLDSPSIDNANFFPAAIHHLGAPVSAHIVNHEGILRSRNKRDSGLLIHASHGAGSDKTQTRPKSWTVSDSENHKKIESFIGNPVSRVPSWIHSKEQGPRALWASMKHDFDDDQSFLPRLEIEATAPVALKKTPRRRSVRWSDMSNFSHNASHLPGSILKIIMSYAVSSAEISKSYMLVCKQWSRAGARMLYSSPSFTTVSGYYEMIQTLLNPMAFHPYPAFVRHFHIPTIISDQLLIGDIDVALQLFPNLESISLKSCPSASNIVVQSISDHSPDLVSLDLAGCPISDSYLPDLFRHIPSLKSINLAGTKVTIATLVNIVDICTQIEHICLDGALPDASPLTFRPLTLSSPSRPLKSLSLRNSSIIDLSLRYVVSHCPDLKRVILDGSSGISDDSIIALALGSSQLETVQLAFCSFVTDVSLYALAKHASHSLRRVALAGCEEVSEQGVLQLARYCTSLQELHLHGCPKILSSPIASYHSGDRHLGVECLIRRESLCLLAKHRFRGSTAISRLSPAHLNKPLHDQENRSSSITPVPILTPTASSPSVSSQYDHHMGSHSGTAFLPFSPPVVMVDANVQTDISPEYLQHDSPAHNGNPDQYTAFPTSRRRSSKVSRKQSRRSMHSQSNRRRRTKDATNEDYYQPSNNVNSDSQTDSEDYDDYYDESRETMGVLKKLAEVLTNGVAANTTNMGRGLNPSNLNGTWPVSPLGPGGPFVYPGQHMSAMQHAAMTASPHNGAGMLQGHPINYGGSGPGYNPYMQPNINLNGSPQQYPSHVNKPFSNPSYEQNTAFNVPSVVLDSKSPLETVQTPNVQRTRTNSHSSGSSNESGAGRWSLRSSTSSNLSTSKLPLPLSSRSSNRTPTPSGVRTSSRLPVISTRGTSGVPISNTRLRSFSTSSQPHNNLPSHLLRSSEPPTPSSIDIQTRKTQNTGSGYGSRLSLSVGLTSPEPTRSFIKKIGPMDALTQKRDMEALRCIQEKSATEIATPHSTRLRKKQ